MLSPAFTVGLKWLEFLEELDAQNNLYTTAWMVVGKRAGEGLKGQERLLNIDIPQADGKKRTASKSLKQSRYNRRFSRPMKPMRSSGYFFLKHSFHFFLYFLKSIHNIVKRPLY